MTFGNFRNQIQNTVYLAKFRLNTFKQNTKRDIRKRFRKKPNLKDLNFARCALTILITVSIHEARRQSDSDLTPQARRRSDQDLTPGARHRNGQDLTPRAKARRASG